MPDDDDRPLDASSAADPAWSDAAQAAAAWAEAVAPDDISELAGDIHAYHRELRAEHRRAVVRRMCARRPAAPVSLLAAALALVALVATLLTVMTPGGEPSARPLAQSSAAVGTVGSLLPSVSLTDLGGHSTDAQELRPAVLALIPLNCDCQPLLSGLAQDASTQQLRTFVIAPSAADAEATALGGRINRGTVYYDSGAALARDFAASGSGVTVLLLNRDGTVFRIHPGVTSEAGLGLVPQLQQMLQRTRG